MNNKQCPFKDLLEPRGPKGLPLVGSVPFLAINPLNFFSKLRNKYGDIAKYKMFGSTSYLISHPEDIARVFKEEKKGVFEKKSFHNTLYEFFGDGLFNSYGENWKKQRNQLKPYFQKSEVSKWLPIIIEESLSHFHTVHENTAINGINVIVPLIQTVMCRVLFGVKPENELSKKLINAIDLVNERLVDRNIKSLFFNGILNKINTPANQKYKKALKIIDDSIQQLSSDSIINKNEGLLPLLSEKMSRQQVRDQLFTLFFAGQDTTANAILWTLYHLAQHPEVQNKVREEVKRIWPTLSATSIIDANDLDKMVYLNAAINESIRLYPPVYATYRDVKKETKLGRYKLNKSMMILSMYVTHRHPELWEHPNKFMPERFINKKNKGLSFYPYGGGMRICLGMHLAKLELTTILALFVYQFEFELESDTEIEKEIYLTLRPKNGVSLVLKSTGYLGKKT